MRVKPCLECQKLITGCKANQKFCNDNCRYAYWARTNRPSQEQAKKPCSYCGLPASTIDHVPPMCARDRIIEMGLSSKYRFIEVDACHECNNLLCGRTLWRVRERKKFIKKILRKRYRKFLNIPDWSPTEVEKQGNTLSEYIKRGIIIRDITIERLKW